jgi:hypothetical protein
LQRRVFRASMTLHLLLRAPWHINCFASMYSDKSYGQFDVVHDILATPQ